MRKIVLASHHLLADGLKDTIQYLMSTLTDIKSVSAYMDNVPVEKQLKEALGEIRTAGRGGCSGCRPRRG